MKIPLLALIFFILFLKPLRADECLENLLNTEVTSPSKIPQKVNEAASVVSLIKKEEIDKYGWTSINEILYHQPGFTPSQDYDRRTVSFRGSLEGWNNNHTLLLIDGIPFNDNLYGSAYTGEITPLFLAKSIEIIRGPSSALYGSNTANGVVSIQTRSASDINSIAEVQVRAGNRGTQIYDAIVGKATDSFSLVVGANVFHTAGNEYRSLDGSGRLDPSGNLQSFPTRDSRSSNYLFTKLEGMNRWKGLSLQFHNQYWDFETGHGWIFIIPDFDESMKESRQILSVSYQPVTKGRFSQEYAIRYQKHSIDWNQRYFPNDSELYPAGLWEYLNTDADDLFARGEFTYAFENRSTLLGGIETDIFHYDGDNEHHSNVNLDSDFEPVPGNVTKPIRPWLEYIENEPVKNVGIYGQFTSGNLLGEKFTATLGIRYDREWFDYTDILLQDRPTKHKSFSEVSPRFGLVYRPKSNFTVKALARRAFRTPSPTELFGANTFSLASNLANLKPEFITTYELASDWQPHKNLNWRLNIFHTKFENQIAYSGENNLSTNIYSLNTAGVETEALFGISETYSGFFNYSYANRLDESIIDPTVQASDDLTWTPAHSLNFGLNYRRSRFHASVSGHFQGKVLRRISDRIDPVHQRLRPVSVDPWMNLDLYGGYLITNNLELSARFTNVLNSNNSLIKNRDFPFDYRTERFGFILEARLKFAGSKK